MNKKKRKQKTQKKKLCETEKKTRAVRGIRSQTTQSPSCLGGDQCKKSDLSGQTALEKIETRVDRSQEN